MISSARAASDLCGREDQLKVATAMSESGHDTKISWLTGKALSNKANIVASKSYNTQSDYRFDTKTFMELRNASPSSLPTTESIPPTDVCYLKTALQRPERFVLCPTRQRGL